MADKGDNGFFAPATGTDIEAKGASGRKASAVAAAKHRKSTVVVDNPDVVDTEGLSAADRALAEMGYVQVSFSCHTQYPSPADCATSLRSTSGSSHGCRASRSHCLYLDSSPVYLLPIYIRSKLGVVPQQCGHG